MARIGWTAATVAGLLWASAVPAAAQTPAPDPRDIECMVITFMMAGSTEAQVRVSGAAATYYYLGKLQAKSPGAEIDKPMLDVVRKLNQEQLTAVGQRCVAELQARAQDVGILTDRLKAAAPPPAPPASPATPPAPAAPAP